MGNAPVATDRHLKKGHPKEKAGDAFADLKAEALM